jgi:hypothetical protein
MVATRGRKEEVIVIQLPNSTSLYLRSGRQSPGATAGRFEVHYYPKAKFTLPKSNPHPKHQLCLVQ